jgi:hypothetical protein
MLEDARLQAVTENAESGEGAVRKCRKAAPPVGWGKLAYIALRT